jgi:hypothetical protein
MSIMKFEQWMSRVDRFLEAICGLGSSDLADVAYYEMYLDGISPRDAALDALDENGYPMEEV